MSSQNQSITTVQWIIIGVVVLAIAIFPFIDKIVLWEKIIGHSAGLLVLGIIGLFLMGKGIYKEHKFRRVRKEQRLVFQGKIREVNEAVKVPNNGTIKVLQHLESDLRRSPQFLEKESQEAMALINTQLERFKQEQAREWELKEQTRVRSEEKRVQQVSDVVEVFKKQKRTDIIPEQFRYYGQSVINSAKDEYTELIRKEHTWTRQREEREEKRAEAFIFVLKNKALPSNFQNLSYEVRCFYDEALELQRQGLLKQQVDELREIKAPEKRTEYITDDDYVQLAGSLDAGKQREEQLKKNVFYFTSELTQNEKNFLLKFHGYKICKVSNFGDGFIYTIYRSASRERPIHFCTKYLFARLHASSRVEIRDWYKNEIDVLFTKGTRKFAVEIERGTNKAEYLRKKVSDLRHAYTKTIIVVPREQLPKYRMYHDGEKVFVLTAKDAKDILLKWLE